MAPRDIRTLVSLSEAELRWLRQTSKQRSISMTRPFVSALKKTVGCWKNRSKDAPDYVEKLRQEWGD